MNAGRISFYEAPIPYGTLSVDILSRKSVLFVQFTIGAGSEKRK